MEHDCHLCIISRRYGRGNVCFFDEPFGEQTPFELAGGYSAVFDTGFTEGGPIDFAETLIGLDAWLVKQGWKRIEEYESLVQV